MRPLPTQPPYPSRKFQHYQFSVNRALVGSQSLVPKCRFPESTRVRFPEFHPVAPFHAETFSQPPTPVRSPLASLPSTPALTLPGRPGDPGPACTQETRRHLLRGTVPPLPLARVRSRDVSRREGHPEPFALHPRLVFFQNRAARTGPVFHQMRSGRWGAEWGAHAFPSLCLGAKCTLGRLPPGRAGGGPEGAGRG